MGTRAQYFAQLWMLATKHLCRHEERSARLLGITKETSTAEKKAVAKSVVGARPPWIVKYSAPTAGTPVTKSVGLGEDRPLEVLRSAVLRQLSLQQSRSLLVWVKPPEFGAQWYVSTQIRSGRVSRWSFFFWWRSSSSGSRSATCAFLLLHGVQKVRRRVACHLSKMRLLQALCAVICSSHWRSSTSNALFLARSHDVCVSKPRKTIKRICDLQDGLQGWSLLQLQFSHWGDDVDQRNWFHKEYGRIEVVQVDIWDKCFQISKLLIRNLHVLSRSCWLQASRGESTWKSNRHNSSIWIPTKFDESLSWFKTTSKSVKQTKTSISKLYQETNWKITICKASPPSGTKQFSPWRKFPIWRCMENFAWNETALGFVSASYVPKKEKAVGKKRSPFV